MRSRLAVAATAVVLAACGSSREAARTGHDAAAGVKVEIRRGGQAVEAVEVGRVDLWRWCDAGVTAVIARGSPGFVQGVCAQRATYHFTLEPDVKGAPTATLTRTDDGGLVARAAGVHAVEVHDGTVTAPPRRGLMIVVGPRAPLVVDAETLDTLLPERERRDGIPLAALLDHAGVTAPTRITVRGETTYEVAPTWLGDEAHELRLRRNRQGLLRFDHREGTVQRARVRSVTHLEID